MRPVNITIKLDPSDTFAAPRQRGDLDLIIRIDQQSPQVSTDAWEILGREGIGLDGVTGDFLRLAVAIYTADQIISRENEGYEGWSRHIRLNMPVYNSR